MCVPGCLEHVHERVASRRGLLRGAAAVGVAAAASLPAAPAAARGPRSFSRVVDLTHPLGPDFPTYFGKPQVEVEVMASYDQQKYNMKRWSVVEHSGTHLDAPIHFSADGASADQLTVEQLVVPVVVIDIVAKAESDPDVQVTPSDVEAFEARHGRIPAGACVAMHSGWSRHLRGPKFRNADDQGKMHFPGFHLEAAQLLIEQRDAIGIAVDTLSLDFGASPDFAVHYAWLPSGRWGLECVANLDRLPPTGATLVVGGPTLVGATGGPSRVMALV